MLHSGITEPSGCDRYRLRSVSDGESAKKEDVDATTPIATTAAPEAWPTKKVLLAVLPPTVALISLAVGVWDNGNRDRADARRAEEARAQEVEDNQAAAASAQSLRQAELVLPKYELLLEDIYAANLTIDRCIDDLNAYLTELPVPGGGERLAIFGDPPDKAALELDNIPTSGLVPTTISVDRAVVESCSRIRDEVAGVGLSLDQALLVSVDELEASATALADALVASSDGADALLRYVYETSPGNWFIDVDVTETATMDGTPLERVAAELNETIFALPALSDELIREARGRILQLDQ